MKEPFWLVVLQVLARLGIVLAAACLVYAPSAALPIFLFGVICGFIALFAQWQYGTDGLADHPRNRRWTARGLRLAWPLLVVTCLLSPDKWGDLLGVWLGAAAVLLAASVLLVKKT